MQDSRLAAVLSLIITGVGQFYNGYILAGISSLLITPGFWIGTRGTLGWIYNPVPACTAYSYACDPQVRVRGWISFDRR
jgi:hypothetical protein